MGQAPRDDVTPDLATFLGPRFEFIEAGALDGMDDFSAVAPTEGKAVLVSRLADGGNVTISETKVVPFLQQAVDRVVEAGSEAVIVLCTALPESSVSASVPVLFPSPILAHAVAACAKGKRIAALVPDQAQAASLGEHWESITDMPASIHAASPYGPAHARQAAAEAIAATDVDYIVLDCIGYSAAMAREIEGISNKPVILPRALIAQAAQDVLNLAE